MQSNIKSCLLVVDDVELNRDMMYSILKDSYEVIEAENGKKAIELIEEKIGELDLVILDLIMPEVSGIEVLQVMNDRKWIKKLPVIVASADLDQDTIDKCFSLGVLDYFTQPLNTTVLLNRIKNVITVQKKQSNDFEDAVTMLSNIYIAMMKVDLTNNFYENIGGRSFWRFSNASNPNFFTDLHQYAEAGNVHKDDLKKFYKFFDTTNILRALESGEKYLTLRFRRKHEDEFRWTLIEFVPSTEFSERSLVLVMYVRDVHEEYLKQLEALAKSSSNAIGLCYCNLSTDKIIAGDGDYDNLRISQHSNSVTQMIEDVTENCPTEQGAIKYYNTFMPENLIQKFKNGETKISLEHTYIIKGDYRIYMRSEARMVLDSMSGDILCHYYAFDITEEYLDKVLPELLYEKDYSFVGIINAINGTMMIRKLGIADPEEKLPLYKILSYQQTALVLAQNYIPVEEREKFMINTDSSYILGKLEHSDSFEFNITMDDGRGSFRVKKFRYMYFQKTTGDILCTSEDVTDISEHDIVTDGLNRRGFARAVETIFNNGSPDEEYDVMYFDINGLKAVNELFGINGGNKVIRHMYQLIKNSELKPLVVARASSDHFIALVRRENVQPEKIVAICSDRYIAGSKTITIYQRCGIYEIEDKELGVNAMVDRAKLAISHVTNEYAKPYAYYSSQMSEKYFDHNELVGIVSDALSNDEFKTYFQPIFSAKTRKIAAAEALIRWKHPTKGMISPGVFIPGLEESGHISQVDIFVQQQVRECLQRRISEGKFVVPVSVNLSRMDFLDEEFMKQIINDVKDAGDMKELYRFEVTESSYVSLAENNIDTLGSIKKMGAKILIDDFGSGYSSFNTISEYDFDVIKIDMGFVKKIGSDPKVEKIIRSMITMSHEIGSEVVAEGAETEEQVNFLTENGCDYIQGYYFSKPVSMAEFEKLLDEQQAAEE
jgi:EAL domain-containing protein (putative c-di-GMP-specific phosphodiesterase class I)/PleD family two-component response regulator